MTESSKLFICSSETHKAYECNKILKVLEKAQLCHSQKIFKFIYLYIVDH